MVDDEGQTTHTAKHQLESIDDDQNRNNWTRNDSKEVYIGSRRTISTARKPGKRQQGKTQCVETRGTPKTIQNADAMPTTTNDRPTHHHPIAD
jgi:hypothetical protein